MSGGEFWIWFVVYGLLVVGAVRLIAAWLDHDDDLDAIGTHRWPIEEEED